MFNKLLVTSVLLLLPLSANALQFLRLDINKKAEIYEIRVEVEVDASPENVRAILTDYANLGRLNDSITASKVIGREANGSVRVLTRMENCVLFFCMNVQKVEDVTEDAQGRILVAMVPDSSNFRSGQASWEIKNTDNGSLVIHHARMEPDVWVPPMIGASVLKNTLREELLESFESLDCLARTQCEKYPEKLTTEIQDDFFYEM